MKYLLTAAMFLAGSAAVAQTNCAPREMMVRGLSENYGESPVTHGLTGGGAYLFEMFANPDSGSWTITRTGPDGILCLVASGQNFDFVDFVEPVKGEPT